MDKFRTTFPIAITFADGEQPTGTKLNAISSQSRSGLALLERAIGDLWNQSGDAVASAYPNRIVNIARALGDQALTTSKIPLPNFTGTTSVRIRQSLTPFLGKSEILLDFKPTIDSTLRGSVDGLRYTASLTYASTESSSPSSDSDWAVDANSAKIKLGAALYGTQPVSYIEYNVAAADFALTADSLSSSSFSVIPSQSQGDWLGLKICQIAANQYHIVLPFRRPDTSPTGLSRLPLGTNNSAEVGSPSTIRYWGPPASGYTFNSTISSNRFYRYTLPQIALDMFTVPVAGTAIPSGTLYLWDTVTNTIIEGVTFRVPSVAPTLGGITGQQTFILQADGITLDEVFNGNNGNFTSSMTTDVPANYQSRFALICVGQSLAESISILKRELTEGNRATGPGKRLSHADLSGTQPAQGTRHALNLPSSYVSDDDHPYLFSRLGSTTSSNWAGFRDRFNNAILGDLLMASTGSGSGNYQNLLADSRKIYFGESSSTAPRIGNTINLLDVNVAGTRHAISMDNAHLSVPTGLARFGINHFYMPDDPNVIAGIFDKDGILAGQLHLLRTVFGGTTQTFDTFTGSVNSTRYIDVDARTSNNINFLGGNLTIGSTDSNVVIGSNSNLRLPNNVLLFGSSDVTGNYIRFNGTNRFSCRISALVNNSWFAAGYLQATSSRVYFGGDETTGPDDQIYFDETRNMFRFFADASTSNAILDAANTAAAWGSVSVTGLGGGLTAAINSGHNIAINGATFTNYNCLRVGFVSAMLDTNYSVVCSCANTTTASPSVWYTVHFANKTTGWVDIYLRNNSGNRISTDTVIDIDIDFHIYGARSYL